MEENLKDIFTIIRDWLRFAEEKNAALIALNLVSIFGAVSVKTQNDVPIPALLSYYLYSFILLNILGLVLALYSFWPQSHSLVALDQEDAVIRSSNVIKNIIKCDFSKNMPEVERNLLYYEHISSYKANEYLTKLFDTPTEKTYEYIEKCYANQIIINSRIAFRKYSYFKAALFCTLSAVLTPLLSIPFSLYIKTANCYYSKQNVKFILYIILSILVSFIAYKSGMILWKANI